MSLLRGLRVSLGALFLSALFASGCGDEDDGAGGTGGGGGESSEPIALTFGAPACHDALCWIAPVPQGNQLLDGDTGPDGTTYLVGEHGTILRASGAGFEAAHLPKGETSAYPHWRAIDASDAGVWIAGGSGAVFTLKGDELTRRAPEGTSTVSFNAVHAFADDDVWLSSREGTIYRFDGSSWSSSLTLRAKQPTATLVGMVASKPNAIAAFGMADATNARLWLFDGEAWTEETPDLLDAPGTILPAGEPLRITGGADGALRLAFTHRLLERTTEGKTRLLYASPEGATFPPSPIVDARTDDIGTTWIALANGAIVAIDAAGGPGTAPDISAARAFARGPEGQLLVLQAAGGVADPSAKTAGARAVLVEAGYGAERCAPSGSDAFCVTRTSTGYALERFPGDGGAPTTVATPSAVGFVRADGKGRAALVSGTSLTVHDGASTRTLTSTTGELTDAVMLDDGTIHAVTLGCSHLRAGPGASAFTEVPSTGGPTQSEQGVCMLHRAAATTVFLSARESTADYQDALVVIRDADGALLQREQIPRMTNFPGIAVTASGTPYITGLVKDTGENTLFRLEGSKWVAIDAPTSEGDVLTAFGEVVTVRSPRDDLETSGAGVRIIRGAEVTEMLIPAHGLLGLTASDAGLFGVSQGGTVVDAGFSGVVGFGLFRVTLP